MTRRPWFVAVAVVVALAVGIGGWWVALRPDSAATDAGGSTGPYDPAAITEMGARMAPTLAPFTVTMSASPQQTEVDFGARLELMVVARGDEPIERVELWDGDRLVGVKVAAEAQGVSPLRAGFTWVAVVPGEHLLMARATEVGGRRSWSRGHALTVGVSEQSLTGPPAFVPLQPGLGAAEAAVQLGVDPSSVLVPPVDAGSQPTDAATSPDAPVQGGVLVLPPLVQGATALPVPPVTVPDPPDLLPVTTVPLISVPPTTTAPTTVPPTTVPPTTVPPTTVPTATTLPTSSTVPATTVPGGSVPLVTSPPSTTPVVTPTTAPLIDLEPPSSIAPTVVDLAGAYPMSADVVALDPVATAEVNDCSVSVTISVPRDTSATVNVLYSGLPHFTAVGTIEAGGTFLVREQQMPGIYTYVVSDDELPNLQSAPVKVSVPSSCKESSGWVGPISIINGVLTVPGPGSGYYLYVPPPTKASTQGTRIPTDERAFITAASDKVNISALIPSFGFVADVTVELWQSDGVGGSAELIATAYLDPPDGLTVNDVIGWSSDLRLTTYSGASLLEMTKNGEQSFSWEADYPVDRVVWQVLSTPLPRTDTDLAPAGLLAVGINETKGSSYKAAAYNTFDVDMAKVPRSGQPPAPTPGPSPAPGDSPPTGLGGPMRAPELPQPGSAPQYAEPWFEDVLVDTNPSTTAEIEEFLQQITNAAGPVVYVRAVPMVGEQVAGIASPTVVVVLPPYAAEGPLSITSATLEAGQVPNPLWNRCAIVDVPWDQPGWQPPAGAPAAEVAALQATYPYDGAWCRVDPEKVDPSMLEEFGMVVVATGEMLIDGYDALSKAYNDAVAYIAAAVAEWNPICKALGGSAEQTCAQYTQLIAAAAVKAALTILGLPAALPSSADVIASARATLEGDISALTAEWLQQMGVPCDEYKQDPKSFASAQQVAGQLGVSIENPKVGKDGKVDLCREIARAVVDKLLDEVQAAYNAQVSAMLGGPAQSAPIPGLTFAPHPAGSFQPMVMTVDAVPLAGTTLDPSFTCTAKVSSGSSWHSPGQLTMQPRGDGTWHGNAILPAGKFDDATLAGKIEWLTQYPNPTVSASLGPSDCFGESGAKGVAPTDVIGPPPGNPPGT